SAAVLAFSSFRQQMRTRSPALARATAVSSPMPEFPPVITVVRIGRVWLTVRGIITAMDDPSTMQQLGVSQSRMLWRGLIHECPACGEHGVIVRWFGLVDRCPTCDLRIERIHGHMLGYLGLNTIVCFSLTFLVLLGASVAMVPNIEPVPLIIVTLIPAVL